MRIKLFLLMILMAALPMAAQRVGIQGVLVDARTGSPVKGATVVLDNQGQSTTSGLQGEFLINNAKPGHDVVIIMSYGYKETTLEIELYPESVSNLGTIKLVSEGSSQSDFDEDLSMNDLLLTESQIEDEEGNTSAITTLAGAGDNVYYNASSYDFSLMRFRLRGYDSQYTTTMINGLPMNDAARGMFSYSMLGGMNRAFRTRTTGVGLDATAFGIGNVGGASNITTYAKDYAPGFNGSVAYTNSNYYLRAMVNYATGLNSRGWAVAATVIGRYSDRGVQPGTFYNSWGGFLSVQKVINPQHSLSLTAFAVPTRRASNTATFEEAYQLTDNHLYNPSWGYQEGKQRSAKVVHSLDPTALLNWIWTPSSNVTVNTGAAVHLSKYASSALNWYNAADPRPDYYRYMPSWYSDDEPTAEFYKNLWRTDDSFRQINWGKLYQVNYLNNLEMEAGKSGRGATYILEDRHSDQLAAIFSSSINARLSSTFALQGGVNLNYTKASYYKTIADLLGGQYWLDTDQYSERDYPGDTDILQNDMNNPDRKVAKGERFGYDYDIHYVNANAWIQNVINLRHWDINYGLTMSYTQFQRDGHMRNGRAPENSFGKGQTHRFDGMGFKAGISYKINGRNTISGHAYYGSQAPLFNEAYVSPRVKDDAITGLQNERVLSGDINYSFNYRRLMGSVSAFWTNTYDGTERSAFFDDQYNTFMNYTLTGVKKSYRGVELGAAYKITSDLTLKGAGTFARYQYRNRPTGVRSYENGQKEDVVTTVYLKNYYVGGTPQQAYSLALDWAAPKRWFFTLTGVYLADSYIDLAYIRHEEMPDLWTTCTTEAELKQKVEEITRQDCLRNNFTLNASIGKLIYLNRSASMNINLSVYNILNKRDIQTGGYQQGRFDYTNYTVTKFPNKYYYAQPIRFYLNVGVRF